VNVLDENIPDSQRRLLQSKRVHCRQIGEELGRKGMTDDEIIPLLLQLDRPTFFTLDSDFYDFRLCHSGYCLVHLDIDEDAVAEFIHRLLRHRTFNSKSKRMGRIIRVTPKQLSVVRLRHKDEVSITWR
jgi:hypothetical protein